MSTRAAQDFVETISPVGYVSNREITNLPGDYLVKGSKNTRIVNKEKVVSAKRYIRKGQAKTVNKPIRGSYDWKTNTGVYRNLRHYLNAGLVENEVWYKSAWQRISRDYLNPEFAWAEWWSSAEQIDLLLGVNGTETMYMWSGGIAEIASATATTLTKKGYLEAALSFDAVTLTINDAASGFLTAGFAAGDKITIQNSATNDDDYVILSVTAGTITLVDSATLVTEAAGGPVIIKWTRNGTWAEARFLTTTAGRSVRIAGITYIYTGGENSGTLTGLTVSPVTNGVVAGDLAMQSIVEYTPTEMADRNNDLIAVLDNHVYVGSTTSRTVLISTNDDFDDFTYTVPLRVPGEGFILTLDATPTALVPSEDEMYVTAGDDDWYKVYMEFTSDQGGQSVIVKKLKTAPGQAAISQSAVTPAKNTIVYLSKEKTIDTLGNIENLSNTQNVPISDDIRDDIEAYDLTGAHMKYYRRSFFLALPAEGVVLEYDMRFGYWQPPQYFPVARLAIIDDRLCGHSSNSNETYVLYEGYNDIDASVKYVAAFGYDNFGSRFSLKNFSDAAVEVYLSRNTILTERILYEYLGASDIREFQISGADEAITFGQSDANPLGSHPLGSQPLGSSISQIPDLVKARAINVTGLLDFFERQRVFEAEGKDIRFEIIAFGENTRMSDNKPNFITR